MSLLAQQFYNPPASLMFEAEGYSLKGFESTVRAAGPELIAEVPGYLRDLGRPRGRNGYWETDMVMADGKALVLVAQVLPNGAETRVRLGVRASAYDESVGTELETLTKQLLLHLHRRHYELLLEEAQAAMEHIDRQLERIARDSISIVDKLEANVREKQRLERELELNAAEKKNLEQEQALKVELKDLRLDEKAAVDERLRQLQAILEEIE